MARKKIKVPYDGAQYRKLQLVVTPGINGYRLAYVSDRYNGYWEEIGEYATIDEANEVRQKVLALTERFGKTSTH
jgi:hypothetical protein